MSVPDWLMQFPIAHRGLHDISLGVIENTISAAQRAIDHGFAIECDVQSSADGIVMVFHDDTLDRLTGRSGKINQLNCAQLELTELLNSKDTIPTFVTFLEKVNGRVPIICEIKSEFDGNLELAEKTAQAVRNYRGPLAIKSFDPLVVAAISKLIPERPCGFIGESTYDDPEWDFLSSSQKKSMACLTHLDQTRPDFLSWYINDLDQGPPQLARKLLGLPLMTWTIRTNENLQKAREYADQIVFEGFIPESPHQSE